MPSRKRRSGGQPFTVEFPRPLEARREGDAWWTDVGGRELRLSNLDKVFWPEEGYTKGDLVAYYANVAELLLPHLAGRPLTMKRMPDGAAGDFFYEKTAPSHTPEWIRRCRVLSDDSKHGVIDYLVVDDLATLLFVANLGCIEMHPLHSRCEDVEHPDYLFFDLDPFEPYTYEDVLAVALHVRVLLDGLGMPSFPKTSGATGMQIYVPLEPGRYTYGETRAFVGACGRLIREVDPEKVTMAWRVADRTGKIFIDHNMNRRGANIASAYSLRPEAGAPVSTPVTWEEVEAGGFEPRDFGIDDVWARFARVGDLFAGVRGPGADLASALDALGVEPEDDEPTSEPLPRTAKPSVRAKTSEDIAAESQRPGPLRIPPPARVRPGGTTEPAPGEQAGDGNSFVIHKHRATRLHYDVRLERDGGLPSWAVPKGLPTKKGDKRLAVQTEVHPLEYGKFEGTIPEGHYGAGEVRIFDDGWYEPVEWTDTKVSFRLHGRRYPGLEFHFVKTRTDWLAFLASAQTAPLIAATAALPADARRGRARGLRRPGVVVRAEARRDPMPRGAHDRRDGAPDADRTRRDDEYPELHMVHELVDQVNAVIDGEIVALDERGKDSFEALQQRMNLANPREIERIRARVPVTLVVFDLLWLDGNETIGLPLEQRRELLELVVETGRPPPGSSPTSRARASRSSRRRGAWARGRRREAHGFPVRARPSHRRLAEDQADLDPGLRRSSASRPARADGRGSFGALLVGAYRRGRAAMGGPGRAPASPTRGSTTLLEQLEPARARRSPDRRPGPRGASRARSSSSRSSSARSSTSSTRRAPRKMRAPSFNGLRPDKTPDECVLEPPAPDRTRTKRR